MCFHHGEAHYFYRHISSFFFSWMGTTTSVGVCGSAYINYIKSCHAIIMHEFFIYRGTLSVSRLQLSGRAAPCSPLQMQPLATDKRRSTQPYHSTHTSSVVPGLYNILARVATVKMWIAPGHALYVQSV